MSLGIVFKGPEGIVLAADSRVTLTVSMQSPGQPPTLIPATYDNATKLLRIRDQNYVGVVTYGVGAFGNQRTAHSYLPEFEAKLLAGDGKRLSIELFAKKLSEFFMQRWEESMPKDFQGPPMTFLVGGYNVDEPYGRVFGVDIPIRPEPKEINQDGFGVTWGGQRELTDRLMQGFDENLPFIAQEFLELSDDQRNKLRNYIKERSTLHIPFQFLPLQDCVDLSIALVRTTITFQKWMVGVRGVGGKIDVATITQTGGFRAVQTKEISGEIDHAIPKGEKDV